MLGPLQTMKCLIINVINLNDRSVVRQSCSFWHPPLRYLRQNIDPLVLEPEHLRVAEGIVVGHPGQRGVVHRARGKCVLAQLDRLFHNLLEHKIQGLNSLRLAQFKSYLENGHWACCVVVRAVSRVVSHPLRPDVL